MKSGKLFFKKHSFNYSKFILVALLTASAFTACKKDSTSASSTTVSQDEAADAVTNAVSPESGGMVAQVDNSTAITTDNASPCGESFDSSIGLTNPVGSAITYDFNLAWQWTFTCSPQSFDFSFKGSSVYSTPRMSSNDSSSGSMNITGIEINKTAYVVNTSYVRDGSQQSKILNKNSFASKIIINSSNINIDKTSLEITSGTATVSINGAATNGVSFSYDGTITFNGNKTATLVMNDGTVYPISWQ